MPIGHTKGVFDYTGKHGNICGLVEDPLIHLIDQFLCRIDTGRDSHAWFKAGRKFPYGVGNLLKLGRASHLMLL
jgi:hypothetical protein